MRLPRTNTRIALLFFVFFLFSYGLMSKTFHTDSAGNLKIATKVWSDFAATLPLIRSFSFGSNIPPQYPIFAGPPIRYHFIFFYLVSLIERSGLTLGFSLNILSSLTFAGLLTIIFIFAQRVFKSTQAGILTVILFLFNGSLSFIEFFKLHPVSMKTPYEIVTNTTFPSFGPYDGKLVSAFWNLNIYTNQRHLALAYTVFLIVLYILYSARLNPKSLTLQKTLMLSFIVGFFPFVHLAVFGMMGIMVALFFVTSSLIRKKTFIIGLLGIIFAAPQILYMGVSSGNSNLIKPGYLVDPLTTFSFIRYWIYNLGLLIPLALLGIKFSEKKVRYLFLIFVTLFVAGNVFKFSIEMSANHKFFNLFVIGLDMFTAHALVTLWKGKLTKALVVIFLPLLILSGVIDLFPILNDSYVTAIDIPNNEMATFIKTKTPRDSTFLNGSFLYDSASIAGRSIYLGWPYFSWSAGYDTDSRYQTMKTILSSISHEETCILLRNENIDYVLIRNPSPLEDVTVNYSMFEISFDPLYKNSTEDEILYRVDTSCNN